jgi:septum site-determining protein MinD
MFRAYTITSGKGGVGKTTLTVNLGISLSLLDRETYILDADIGMANMALILGMDEVPVTLHEVLAGKADIEDAIYEGPAGVKVVPSGISLQGFQQADPDKLRDVMHKLVDRCEFLLIDAPSGISKEGVVPLSVADQVILVVNPELASMADALKTKILCEVMGGNVYGAILNRAGQEHTELRSHSVEDVLGVRVVDVVPEDASVRKAAAYKTPCVLKYPNTDASRAFKRIAAQMSGVEYEEQALEPKQEGFVDRLARAVFRWSKIFGEIMAYEGIMLVLFGGVIVVQQFIIYLMYVRIRQLLDEIDSIEGKIKITDTELENLISRVEEFKRGNL